MDTSQAVTHLGLCAGYGGIELGLKRAVPGLRTVALCEIEAFAIANLVSKMEAGLMDPAPIWPDLKTFPWAVFCDRVDILSGGYPCQPFSAAGQRRGKDDPRHLWPYIADGIRLLRPRCCFFENVEGHISLGLSDVIEDLAGMGYRTTWGIFSASECGAPHQRKRVFILAHHNSERGQEFARRVSAQSNTPPLGTFVLLANSSSQRSPAGISEQESRYEREPGEPYHSGHQAGWPSRPGEQQYGWEPPRVVSGGQIVDDTQERGLRDDSDNQRQTVGEGNTANDSGSCSGEELGDSKSWQDHGRELGNMGVAPSQGGCSDNAADIAGEAVMADASISRCNGRPDRISGRSRESGEACEDAAGCGGESNGMRQTQPPLGGDTNGPTSGLDYAELCVTCDNRTDELRLLGNGVVPATAEQAFRTLMRELDTTQASR